jgi:predicted MFS family arabinose efflux permease
MGFLTDRMGHKRVLVPALIMMAALLWLVPAAGDSRIELALVVLALGAFLFSLHAILISAATELAGQEMQSTMVSLIYAAGFIGSLAPTAAGIVADAYGTSTIFILAGVLVLVAAAVLSPAPLRGGRRMT